MGELLEHLEHPLLGRHIEIDQQVAAEHEVVLAVTGLERRVQHVADFQADLPAHPLVELVGLGGFAEMPLAKGQFAAAERVAPIQRLLGLGHRIGADIDAIDTEGLRRDPAIEQCHGDGIGLFTGRARQAEDAQRPGTGQFGHALVGQVHQRGKGFGVTEEPGFGDDDRLDQGLLLGRGLLQAQPVIVQVGGLQGNAALAQGPLDHRRPDRLHVQADAFLQEAEEPLPGHVGTCPASLGYNSWRTVAGSRSSTRIRCTSPCAS